MLKWSVPCAAVANKFTFIATEKQHYSRLYSNNKEPAKEFHTVSVVAIGIVEAWGESISRPLYYFYYQRALYEWRHKGTRSISAHSALTCWPSLLEVSVLYFPI